MKCITVLNILCSMLLCLFGFADTDGVIQAGEVARRRRSQSRSRRSSRSSWELPPPLVEPNIQSCHASDDQQTLVDAQCKFAVIIIMHNFSFASQEHKSKFLPSFPSTVLVFLAVSSMLLYKATPPLLL